MIVPTQVDASRAGRTVLVPGQIVGMPPAPAAACRPALGRAPAGPSGPADARTDSRGARPRLRASLRTAGLGHRAHARGWGASAMSVRVCRRSTSSCRAPASSAARRRSRSCTRRCAPRSARPDAPAASTSCSCGSLPGWMSTRASGKVRAALAQALPGVGTTVTRGTEERAYRVLYDDARSDQRILNVFAFLVLGGAAFAAFNLISRVVESERREIGVGMALGVPPRALALRPLLMGAQIALLGTALGIAIGVGFAGWLDGRVRGPAAATGLCDRLPDGRVPGRRGARIPAAAGRDGLSGLARCARGADRGDQGRLPGGQGRRLCAAPEADQAARARASCRCRCATSPARRVARSRRCSAWPR